MDGSHGKITEFLDYNELARHAPQRIIENHFPGLVPVNLGLKARGADYVREMFQRDFKAAMLLEDATDSVMPYFPGAWK